MRHPSPCPRPLRTVVVVPARDEEELLPAALAALQAAVRELHRREPAHQVQVVVVLDSCTDGSRAIIDAHPWVSPVVVDVGRVGGARAAGVRLALENAGRTATAEPAADPTTVQVAAAGDGLDTLWLATTDADSQVPVHWLTEQLRLARAGHHLVLGTVSPRPQDLPPHQLTAWRSDHHLAEGHPHVHAANLGLSAACYVAVGGFADVAVHEDVDLAARVVSGGWTWCATDRTRVLTSGRTTGRTPDGFAGWLRRARTPNSPLTPPQASRVTGLAG